MASEEDTVSNELQGEVVESTYDSGSDNDDNESQEIICENEESFMRQTDIISVNEMYAKYNSSSRVTQPRINRFEKAKMLGVRSEMLANGSPALINVPPGMSSTYEIAKLEYRQKKIPLIIKRRLPNKTFEYWKLDDLVLI
jgi:DNA-directed RNA polymerases I, II, and III subunit RPABC2